ncbi:Elongator complex protein 2-like protein 2 [Elsinoe fawcettii]|nr:Elongator complex protein 2-like protein 2 [Elsinoe fawcettii]
MININQSFISAGGNRHPNAADWKDGVLAFGSGHNVAIWNALHNNDAGVDALLRGHTDDVNAVRLLQHAQHARPRVLSGAADKTVRLWTWQTNRYLSSAIAPHDGSVNSIAVLQDSGVFATGCADGTVHIWSVQDRPGKGDMADDYKTFQTYEA